MKWMIASDIHGSAFFAKQLLDRFRDSGCERLLLLGDILYHGPRNDLPRDYNPKAVAAMLNEYKNRIISVRGNCDAEIDALLLQFPSNGDYALLPTGTHVIFATHGHIYNKANVPALSPGDILLQGHTHVPECTCLGGVTLVNPGSVSIPKEGSPNSYMVLSDDELTWFDITGNPYKTHKIS